jgi:lipid-binding SYLF domain-containing protein
MQSHARGILSCAVFADAGANEAFYGKAVSPVDILVRHTVNNSAAAPLQQSLRQMAR